MAYISDEDQLKHHIVFNSRVSCFFFIPFFFLAKTKEVESLKKQLEEHGSKTDLREKDELEQKIKDTQQQLKKAKKRALLAKGNLIKKETELHYLKSIIQISQG